MENYDQLRLGTPCWIGSQHDRHGSLTSKRGVIPGCVARTQAGVTPRVVLVEGQHADVVSVHSDDDGGGGQFVVNVGASCCGGVVIAERPVREADVLKAVLALTVMEINKVYLNLV